MCKIIPNKNKKINERMKEILKNIEMNKAPIIVNITSTIAIFNKRYECIPLLGTPKAFLYLHKFINI